MHFTREYPSVSLTTDVQNEGRRYCMQSHVWTEGLGALIFISVLCILGLGQTRVFAMGQQRLPVCHIDDEGNKIPILISDAALDTHIAHGDIAQQLYYPDADGDTFGDINSDGELHVCPPTDLVADHTDCDDEDDTVHEEQTWYHDGDSDTYGDPYTTMQECHQPDSYVADNTDCDDGNDAIYPGQFDNPFTPEDSDCDPLTPPTDVGVCPCAGVDGAFETALQAWEDQIEALIGQGNGLGWSCGEYYDVFPDRYVNGWAEITDVSDPLGIIELIFGVEMSRETGELSCIGIVNNGVTGGTVYEDRQTIGAGDYDICAKTAPLTPTAASELDTNCPL